MLFEIESFQLQLMFIATFAIPRYFHSERYPYTSFTQSTSLLLHTGYLIQIHIRDCCTGTVVLVNIKTIHLYSLRDAYLIVF